MSHVLVHCKQNLHDSPQHMTAELKQTFAFVHKATFVPCICGRSKTGSILSVTFTMIYLVFYLIYFTCMICIFLYLPCWIPTGDDCKEKQTSRTVPVSTGSSRAPWLIEALLVLVTFTGFVLTGSYSLFQFCFMFSVAINAVYWSWNCVYNCINKA